ncbi:response regulator [bacterium]|nr:response regulator [bacterium]
MSAEIQNESIRPGVDLHSANVLIIEDEPLMSALLGRYIRQLEAQNSDTKFSFSVHSEGWHLLGEDLSHVKVAIVDILLPKITGVDLVKDFRKRYPHMGIVPISGMATEPFKRKLTEILPAGFSLIDKPIRPEIFNEAFLKAYNFKDLQLLQPKVDLNQEAGEPLWTAVEPTNSTVTVSTMRRKLLRKKA